MRYIKLRDRFDVITLLSEKTLKESMVDKKIDEKEAEDLKKIYNNYLDNRKEIMKKTSFKVEVFFGDVINKDSISPEQITKLKKNFSQIIVNINFVIKIKLFKPRKGKNKNYEPSAPPENSKFY